MADRTISDVLERISEINKQITALRAERWRLEVLQISLESGIRIGDQVALPDASGVWVVESLGRWKEPDGLRVYVRRPSGQRRFTRKCLINDIAVVTGGAN